jgi:hypothetical protein
LYWPTTFRATEVRVCVVMRIPCGVEATGQ